MNASRRVLVINRHFWPTTNDDTLRLFHWTQHLSRQGAQVTVVTPRWHSSWPRRITCDAVQVQRLDSPPTHSLRWGAYARQLSQWLSQHLSNFDLVYCDRPDADAAAVVPLMPQVPTTPFVVRYDPLPHSGSPLRKAVDICRRANKVLASTVVAEQQLLSAGIHRAAIQRLGQTAGICYDRNLESRRAARQILGDANHDLFARSHDQVLVCPGELNSEWRIADFIRELAPLIEEYRCLRVWILGDSRERPALYELLRHEGLHRLVAMPGIFTDLQEIFQAADLCVFPAPGMGLGWLLPTCIASSVPVLAADCPDVRRMLGDQSEQLILRSDVVGDLRRQVASWLHQPTRLAHSISQVRKSTSFTGSSRLGCDELFQWMEASA
jgi:glycosyltransferase involved in cell wall biosynthesis